MLRQISYNSALRKQIPLPSWYNMKRLGRQRHGRSRRMHRCSLQPWFDLFNHPIPKRPRYRQPPKLLRFPIPGQWQRERKDASHHLGRFLRFNNLNHQRRRKAYREWSLHIMCFGRQLLSESSRVNHILSETEPSRVNHILSKTEPSRVNHILSETPPQIRTRTWTWTRTRTRSPSSQYFFFRKKISP